MATQPLTAREAAQHAHDDDLNQFRAPAHAGTIGLICYLLGLTVAFAWLFIGYLVAYGRSDAPVVTLPAWFWFSTGLVLVSSLFIHWAWRGAAEGRIVTVRHGLTPALLLGFFFLITQVMGFIALLTAHADEAASGFTVYRMILFMALLHGLHLLGGLGYLTALVTRVHRITEPAQEATHLKQVIIYWHYLAAVWIAMFCVFLISHKMV